MFEPVNIPFSLASSFSFFFSFAFSIASSISVAYFLGWGDLDLGVRGDGVDLGARGFFWGTGSNFGTLLYNFFLSGNVV